MSCGRNLPGRIRSMSDMECRVLLGPERVHGAMTGDLWGSYWDNEHSAAEARRLNIANHDHPEDRVFGPIKTETEPGVTAWATIVDLRGAIARLRD